MQQQTTSVLEQKLAKIKPITLGSLNKDAPDYVQQLELSATESLEQLNILESLRIGMIKESMNFMEAYARTIPGVKVDAEHPKPMKLGIDGVVETTVCLYGLNIAGNMSKDDSRKFEDLYTAESRKMEDNSERVGIVSREIINTYNEIVCALKGLTSVVLVGGNPQKADILTAIISDETGKYLCGIDLKTMNALRPKKLPKIVSPLMFDDDTILKELKAVADKDSNGVAIYHVTNPSKKVPYSLMMDHFVESTVKPARQQYLESHKDELKQGLAQEVFGYIRSVASRLTKARNQE